VVVGSGGWKDLVVGAKSSRKGSREGCCMYDQKDQACVFQVAVCPLVEHYKQATCIDVAVG
jgi:hypothetical protein